MTFTHAAVLWALPLALAPLLLHLLSRRRARRADFSDLTLLRRVQAQALPRTRLRQWLLAAARCGIILALVFAYAGPVLEAGGARAPASADAAGEGLDVVLLLDCSLSMGVVEQGRTRRSAVRAAADDLLRSLRPADRVACAAFSDRLEGGEADLDWTTPRACLELFDRQPPGYRGTDYAAALRPAYRLLAGSRRERVVLLLSDAAAHGFRGGPLPAEPGVRLYGLAWPPAPPNTTVLTAGPTRESRADKPALRAVLWGSAKTTTALDLWQDRLHLAASAVAVPAGEPASVVLPLPPARPGSAPNWSGRLVLRPDVLPEDDAWYYSFQHPRRPRLLVLYGNPAFLKAPEAGYFLQELLGETKGRLLEWDAEFAGLERFPFGSEASSRLADYDAAVLADLQTVPPQAAAALELFVRRGGGLWVLPGRRTSAQSLAPMAAWLPAQTAAASEAGSARGLRVAKAAAPFDSWREFELDKVWAAPRFELRPRPGATVWLRATDGGPFLVAGLHGEGRTALWAAPLDAISGNLPVKPVFAALVSATVSLLRQPAGGVESFAARVGEPVVRAWAAKEAAPERVKVRSPEGRVTSLLVKDRRVEYGLTNKPGLYTMEDDGGGRRVYAVNADRSAGESDLSPAPSPPWVALEADGLRESFWLKVRGRDVRAAALGAAAALLLVEMALALPKALMVVLLLCGLAGGGWAQEGDRFVWTQTKVGPGWDPYPDAPSEVLDLLATVTSVLVHRERRVVTPQDPVLFYSPLVVLAGRESPPPLDAQDIQRLRAYLAAGGMLWIEDTSGLAKSSFDRWVRGALKEICPESELQALGSDHVVYKTFFLLRGAAGRSLVRGTLEGVALGGRTAVVYSRNDLLGAWVKDALGRPLWPCVPGGEAQRHNARKLTLNIIMYSLTGSYKADAVHQPFLLQKMRSGVP